MISLYGLSARVFVSVYLRSTAGWEDDDCSDPPGPTAGGHH